MLAIADREFILGLAFAFLHALTCGMIAQIKGRRAWLWFLVGWFTPAIGIILVACLPGHEVSPDYRALFRQGFRHGSASRSHPEPDANSPPSREADDTGPETDAPRPRP